jgi:nucleotide-binding universal stress UspA family protein
MFPETHKILYATDLSPNSPVVLRYAINSAIKNDAEIIILYVFEHEDPTRRAMLDLYLDKNQRQKIFAEHTTEARELIAQRLKKLRDRELKNIPELDDESISIELCEGFPAEEILRKADEFNCDLIIMGTHGKGILRHTFLGSTSKRVLRRTRKPVCIVPMPKEIAESSPEH